MSQVNKSAIHCINPECSRPYPQPWGNKFCNSCGASLQLLERYVPLQPLGSGGFAQIYTVWDVITETDKVLKVLIEDSPKALELFIQEADILCHLEHPGVPEVDLCGSFQLELSYPKPRKLTCLVMEKINGLTLEEIQKHYPQGCPPALVLNWLMQAIDILNHLHQRKIIHRDIKPSNIMLRSAAFSRGGARGDQLVLIDFGGVKQVSTAMLRFPNRSTRLFSSGYSPPEQLLGSNVGPQADFYALGRTMIELLTGKNPADLEDSATGELRWRHLVNIKPKLADLLDEMVKSDSRSRPTSAINIQKRLAQISQASPAISVFSQVQQNVQQTISKITQQVSQAQPSPALNFFLQSKQFCQQVTTALAQATSKTIIFTAKTFISIIFACLSTIWAMLLTGIGASIGTIVGFLLANQTNWGNQLSLFVSNQLPGVLPNTENSSGAGIIVFAIAGLGTAWGLTITGVFGQKRRYIIASLASIIGYGLGWIVLQTIAPKSIGEALMGLILIAVSFLTLGIGLRSHHLVHSVITAFGTAITFALLIGFNLFSPDIFNAQLVSIGSELPLKIIFFSSIGIFLSFYLAVSHYLIVPWLRLLGWN
ncbi:protein kinase domain-containing protein [Calothrix sp. UHCC 0171]|uniref:protein kinase domain-containing protein n=1 Tax=Calothrix sp. UHCC 0171 TaxID=3110245 RepID=UPI002B2206B4|nr:protein kinase [Calothrix sp. UHCC 0171]MEA5572816.1 protein kinase [Calothrix sp. UHCC 0171]